MQRNQKCQRTLMVNDYKWKASPESNNEKAGEETLEISILMHFSNIYYWATHHYIRILHIWL